MARFFFFLLLTCCAAVGTHIYLSETKPSAEAPREVNRDALKIVAVPVPVPAPVAVSGSVPVVAVSRVKPELPPSKSLTDAISGAACVEFSVKSAEATRAQKTLSEGVASDRITSRNVEEYSKYIVSLPAFDERKAAADVVAKLKKAGVKDLQIMSDNAISLGAFSTEEAAIRHFAELEKKVKPLVRKAVITPRGLVTKETLFTVREPDANMVARLTVMQREFEGSTVKAVDCPAAPAAPATVTVPAKG